MMASYSPSSSLRSRVLTLQTFHHEGYQIEADFTVKVEGEFGRMIGAFLGAEVYPPLGPKQ